MEDLSPSRQAHQNKPNQLGCNCFTPYTNIEIITKLISILNKDNSMTLLLCVCLLAALGLSGFQGRGVIAILENNVGLFDFRD